MSNKCEIQLKDLKEVGVALFHFKNDHCIVLMINEREKITVVSCTKDELESLMKGTIYEP